MKRDWENSELHTRNMDVQGSGEDSNVNENHVTGTWRKSDSSHNPEK